MTTDLDRIALKLHKLDVLKEKQRVLARDSLQNFVNYTFQGYDMQWFHKCVCHYLDKLFNGDIKKLMIFIPPQHGKSELSSRRFPAYVLGKNPDTKIAVCSYSGDIASGFNRDIQRIMDEEKYINLFPNTRLNSKRVATDSGQGVLRNSTIFQIVNHKGYLKTVGVEGALTSLTVDLGIIDDPFKDRATANSITIRNRAWDWYQDVFKTRMHNDSKQLMLFTRWHEDDLAGRILDPNNPHYDEKVANEWTVIALPALKEATKVLPCALNILDPRQLGEALWETKHSKETHETTKRTNRVGFASLCQQRPAPLEGDMIEADWFTILKPNELPFRMDNVSWSMWIDGAWTKKESDKRKKQNDPDDTAVSYVYFDKANNNLYIRNVTGVKKEISELVKYLDQHARLNGINSTSKVFIEMKASGWAIKPLLQEKGFNCVRIPNKLVAMSKFNMVELCEASFSSGRVFLIQERGSNWIPSFLSQCTSFPNGAHDDKVDVLVYPTLYYIVKPNRKAQTNMR